MKKLLFLSLAAIISFGAMAQHGNHNNGKNKKQKHEKKHNKKDHDDDDDRNGQWNNNDDRRRDNNDRWDNRDDRRNDDRRYDNQDNNGNSTNLPRRVSDAFARDYPNATNVSWTKDRGVWSARFRRSGVFGGNTTVSYNANGQRVNNNNPVYNNNDNRNGQQGNSKPNRIFGQ
ncbi:MAG TPA: hypothetical protein VLR49_00630 [Ferruginibacter sp.]|nr:hypothetical protein [Ferruginibacter sp.]